MKKGSCLRELRLPYFVILKNVKDYETILERLSCWALDESIDATLMSLC